MATKSLNQERAAFCLRMVKAVKDGLKVKTGENRKSKDVGKDKFSSYAKKLPSLIITNGLLPTLAFLFSKEDSTPVGYALALWLHKQGYLNVKVLEIPDNTDKPIVVEDNLRREILEALANMSATELRAATLEALALADWLKRTVEATLDEKEKGGGG